MNYISKQHKLTSTDYEGLGVYEFGVQGHWDTRQQGMAQFPGMPTGMPSPEEAITTVGGIQVIKGEYRDIAVGMLDQTTFDFDQPDHNAPMVTGQSSVILGTLGSGWASDYLAKPVEIKELRIRVEKALEGQALRRRSARARAGPLRRKRAVLARECRARPLRRAGFEPRLHHRAQPHRRDRQPRSGTHP